MLRALELDPGPARERWFDAAVVSKPDAIAATALPRLALATQRRAGPGNARQGRPGQAPSRAVEVRSLLDYATLHGQHFDAFLGLPGFATGYVPMQPYLLAAMDLMDARLRGAAAGPGATLRAAQPRGDGRGRAARP